MITPKAINLPFSSSPNHFSFTLNVPYVPFTLTNLIDQICYFFFGSIKLVKVKGTYGTFKVKEKWLGDEEKGRLIALGVIIILAIVFW